MKEERTSTSQKAKSDPAQGVQVTVRALTVNTSNGLKDKLRSSVKLWFQTYRIGSSLLDPGRFRLRLLTSERHLGVSREDKQSWEVTQYVFAREGIHSTWVLVYFNNTNLISFLYWREAWASSKEHAFGLSQQWRRWLFLILLLACTFDSCPLFLYLGLHFHWFCATVWCLASYFIWIV